MRRPSIRPIVLVLSLLAATAHAQDEPRPFPPGPAMGDDHVVSLLSLFFDIRPGPLDEAQIAGQPAGSRPAVIGVKPAYALAIARFRSAKPARFATLDAAQAAAGADDLHVDDFARLRQDFMSDPGFADPSPAFLDLQARVVGIEADFWHLAGLEKWMGILHEMIRGESSGLTQLDVDAFDLLLQDARGGLDRELGDYRERLDAFKVTLGLSPRAPITIDLASLAVFRQTFHETDRWLVTPRRDLPELARLYSRLPTPGDVEIEGRSIFRELEDDPGRLEELLALAAEAASRRGEADPEAEIRVRQRVRRLAEVRGDYSREVRHSVLALRRLSDLFEQIIHPLPGDRTTAARPARSVFDLASHAQKVADGRSRMVALWNEFQAGRLALNRDLGLFPFADWAAFHGQFDAKPTERPEIPIIDPPVIPAPEPVPPPAPRP